VSRLRGRAVQRASHDLTESGAFSFVGCRTLGRTFRFILVVVQEHASRDMAPLPCGVTNPCDNPFDFGDACEPSGGGSGGGGVAVPVVVPPAGSAKNGRWDCPPD